MRGYRFRANPLDRKVIVHLNIGNSVTGTSLMTCDGEGLFGLGGLGFVMAGEYVLLGFRNSYFQGFLKENLKFNQETM
ncbi:uncharacterized protein OCT59_026782 [Rhizophagus irregularis]|uniref:Uncharacterized protein n=1 Tax=Rhizophagus irregularis (strain DAOM 197198w) TaxID=1432141 RepID=A0A015KI74_RHIIW|nr:hypothetical protein RirG_116460 [Rhizophagus irregularis DAOM 197198w]UZO06461.1 hypothetical protein OCT59_026782 [Rhizophagus irregularis]GBC16316.1 hypothetical protein GLOIN_2v1662292 [Rhizophagus irregularis DAOM 181602=DAOM 197198]